MGNKNASMGYKIAKYVLLIFLLVAILSPILVGDRPLICKSESGFGFPFVSEIHLKDHTNKTGWCILPLIPYGPSTMDAAAQQGAKPLYRHEGKSSKFTHWLGTDRLGRDVLAGIVYGTATAFKIGFFSVFLSFLIGVTLGMSAAYFGDDLWRLNLIQWIFGCLVLLISSYYLWYEFLIFSVNVFHFIIYFLIIVAGIFVVNRYLFNRTNAKRFAIPLDTLVMKLIEIRKSIPGLFLILSLIVLFPKPSIWNIVIVISLMMWTDFARFARAETLAVKGETYIQSARVLGYDSLRILFIHILPNILPTLLVVICFNISSAIILESSLSFLGIGLPVEEISWGKLLAEGRNMKLWWLVVFPGFAIFVVVLCLNILATNFQNIGPKNNLK